MTLDLLKVTLVVFLASLLSDHPWALSLGGLSAAIGHCYPLFSPINRNWKENGGTEGDNLVVVFCKMAIQPEVEGFGGRKGEKSG